VAPTGSWYASILNRQTCPLKALEIFGMHHTAQQLSDLQIGKTSFASTNTLFVSQIIA
jgi:hypothetical protein